MQQSGEPFLLSLLCSFSYTLKREAAPGVDANMAKLQAEPGSQPSRTAFAHTSGHLSSATFTTAVYPKSGWAATPAVDRRAGRSNRLAGCIGGVERNLI